MNKSDTLETVRNLTPDRMLFSSGATLKIALLRLVARLLPGGFTLWLSLLDDGRLERRVQVKFGLGSIIPGSRTYAVPRLHLIVERRDWLALQEQALRAIEKGSDESPPSQQDGSGPPLKFVFGLLRRIGRDLADVHGRIRINFLEVEHARTEHTRTEHARTLTLALDDDSIAPSGSFFDVDIPGVVLDSLLAGDLDLSSALLRGRIHVGGDTGLAARLVNAINPPPADRPGLPTPNTYIGLSDHPLDRKAINLANVFDLFGSPPRTAACVLRVSLRERRGNSFVFRARGYDVYHNRRMEADHKYVTTDEMPYIEMTWRLDFLRSNVYRVRLSKGDNVLDNTTPMVVGNIVDSELAVTRQVVPPWGLFGGKPGAVGKVIVQRDTSREGERSRPSLLYPGESVSVITPGAGGYGDPRERDRALVLRDLAEGKISRESAIRDYGLDPGEMA